MKKETTRQILRNKYPEQECVLLQEVSDASGFARSRSLDFMVVNLWQSRGLSIIGIEQKSNRGDWLKELKNPAKQENHFKHCDYFYLLTDKEGVAKMEEIPECWGWMHINDKGVLKVLKEAPKQTPQPVNRSFLCAMIRRAAAKDGFIHRDSVNDFIEAEVQRKILLMKSETDRKASYYDELKEKLDVFEEATGLSVRYSSISDIPKIGEAVRTILQGNSEYYIRMFERIADQAKGAYDNLKERVALIKKVEINKPNSEQEQQRSANTLNSTTNS